MAWSTLTTRERNIAIGTAAVAALALLYYFVVQPFIERSAEITRQRQAFEDKLADNRLVFDRQQRLHLVWADLRGSGTLKNDASEAKAQLMQALETWAGESGITWTTLNSEHASAGAVDPRSDKPEGKFDRVVVHATGSGTMAAMTNLMWRIESAPTLLKVNEVVLTPRKENTDDLQIQLTVSTVSVNPEAEKAAAPPGSVASAGARGKQP